MSSSWVKLGSSAVYVEQLPPTYEYICGGSYHSARCHDELALFNARFRSAIIGLKYCAVHVTISFVRSLSGAMK